MDDADLMASLQNALGSALESAADDDGVSDASTLQTLSSHLSAMVRENSVGESKEDLLSEPARERDSFMERTCSVPKPIESPLIQTNAVTKWAVMSSAIG